MTNEPDYVIGSSSTPPQWVPPQKHERPAYNPANITAAEKGNRGQHPVIDDQGAGDVSPTDLAKGVGCKPQMIYNYIKQGLLPCKINGQGRKRIPKDAADQWAAKYLENKDRREREQRDRLERQLNGIDN